MDVSNEDLITLPKRNSRLVKTPAAKGTWRSAKEKQKAIVESSIERDSCGDSKSKYCNFDEEANSSNNNGGSEGGMQTGIGVHSSPASKLATKKVCSLLPLFKRFVFAMPSLSSRSLHVVENARMTIWRACRHFVAIIKTKELELG